MIGIEPLCTQHRGEIAALLAMAPQEKMLGLEIIEADRFLAPEAMCSVEDHVERLIKELPAVEPVPGLADRSSDGELGVAGLKVVDDLRPGATQDLELDVAEALSQFVDMRQDETEFDAARYSELERADLSVVDHGGERAGALGAVVALLQQWKHPFAKRREHRARPLAPEKIATQFTFQEFDGARQRWLCHMTFFRRAGEIQRPRDRQEISHLVHFHSDAPLGDH